MKLLNGRHVQWYDMVPVLFCKLHAWVSDTRLHCRDLDKCLHKCRYFNNEAYVAVSECVFVPSARIDMK